MKKLLSIKYTTNACALTAICYVSKKDEETLFRLCKAYNLNFMDGLHDHQWQRVCRMLGITMKACLREEMTLRDFIKSHPKGCYFVGTVDHLFVVDDSTIFDPRTKKLPGLGRTLVQAWKVLHTNSDLSVNT